MVTELVGRKSLGDTGWLCVKTASGLKYYVNAKTHATVWAKPAEVLTWEQEQAAPADNADEPQPIPRHEQVQIALDAIEKYELVPTSTFDQVEKTLMTDTSFTTIPVDKREEVYEAARKMLLKGRTNSSGGDEVGGLADLSELLKSVNVKPSHTVDELISLYLKDERWKRLLDEEEQAVRARLSAAIDKAEETVIEQFRSQAEALRALLKRHLVSFVLERNPWERWIHTADACTQFLDKLEDHVFVNDMTGEEQIKKFRAYLQQALLERNCGLLEMTSLHHPADVGPVVKPGEVRRQQAERSAEQDTRLTRGSNSPPDDSRDIDYATDDGEQPAPQASGSSKQPTQTADANPPPQEPAGSADESLDATSAHKFPSWCMLCREKKIWRDCAAYLDQESIQDLVGDAFQELCQEWWAKKDAFGSNPCSSAGEEVMEGDVDSKAARMAPAAKPEATTNSAEALKIPLELVEIQQQRRRKNKKRRRRFSYEANCRRRRGGGGGGGGYNNGRNEWHSREARDAPLPAASWANDKYSRRYNDSGYGSRGYGEPVRNWRDNSRDRYYDDRADRWQGRSRRDYGDDRRADDRWRRDWSRRDDDARDSRRDDWREAPSRNENMRDPRDSRRDDNLLPRRDDGGRRGEDYNSVNDNGGWGNNNNSDDIRRPGRSHDHDYGRSNRSPTDEDYSRRNRNPPSRPRYNDGSSAGPIPPPTAQAAKPTAPPGSRGSDYRPNYRTGSERY